MSNNKEFPIRGNTLINPFAAICVILVLSTLITSHLLIYRSLTPVFLYLVILGFASFYCGTRVLFSSKILMPAFGIVHWAFLLWGCYIIFDAGAIHRDVNLWTLYLLSLVILFFLSTFLLRTANTGLFIGVAILAVAESSVCFLQLSGALKSLNELFPVTGSWDNPNVTAMFLAMSLPAGFICQNNHAGAIRRLGWIAFVVVVCTVLILGCRTAIIGAIVIIVMAYAKRWRAILLQSKSWIRILCVVIAASIVIAGSMFAYKAKQASADGRLLIWKISWQMIREKPFFGYGYGRFEKYYNLSQSEYFKNNQGTPEELKNAGFVHMGYNEFLQNGVEGGLIGLLLLILVFYSLLRSGYGRSEYRMVYAGVIAFLLMSVFNFSIQAVPAMVLFVLYAAVLTNQKKTESGLSLKIGGLAGLLSGLGLLLYAAQGFYYQRLNQQARQEARGHHLDEAIATIDLIGDHLANDEDFWITAGNISLEEKDFSKAVVDFNWARSLTSDPFMYSQLALSYEKMQDYAAAEEILETVRYIEPTRLTPKYELMNLYLAKADTTRAVAIAQQIVHSDPKVASEKAAFYKLKAADLLRSLKETKND